MELEDIIIKNEYNNGIEPVLEIYGEHFKILEVKKDILWNATETEPITVTKDRFSKGEYVLSDVELEVVNEENEPIEENSDKPFEDNN